jgi:hypothetical protein
MIWFGRHRYFVEQLHLPNRSYGLLVREFALKAEMKTHLLYPCLKRLALGALGMFKDILDTFVKYC